LGETPAETCFQLVVDMPTITACDGVQATPLTGHESLSRRRDA
jgi:hypothetical protein